LRGVLKRSNEWKVTKLGLKIGVLNRAVSAREVPLYLIAYQEKYLRELSITPVGYFMGAKSLPWAWGVPQGLFCMVKMRYFRATGMIFPWLPLHSMEFEGIWG
jgi:hypothetical protein